MNRVYCLVEDREREEVGLRFAVASLLRACPTARVVVYRSNPSVDFRRWLGKRSRAELVPEMPAGASSWNCKPHALLPLLEGEADEAVWLDSDILVARDPSYLFDAHGPDVLVGAEEPQPAPLPLGWSIRTRAWGLEPGRDSPMTLNSCVVRVTRAHIPLLKRWRELLADPTYLAAQRVDFPERPFHLWGDQDVLNALLGARGFEGFPVHYLRIGRDVIHSGGALTYPVGRRLAGLFRRIPPFLHAQAGKPWIIFDPGYRQTHPRWFTFYRRLLQETSPYVGAARRLRAEVEVPCPWLDAWSLLGVGVRLVGFGHFALRGLPLTAVATTAIAVRNLTRRKPPAAQRTPEPREAVLLTERR
jgi:hypothetical protein